MLADYLPSILKPVAKAVAVFIAAWIAAGIAWLSGRIGWDIPGYDPSTVETVVTSVLFALVTWVTTNVKRHESTVLDETA